MTDYAGELGVTLAGDGVDVAIVSQAAEAIAFCTFDADGTERRTLLTERTGDVFHAHIPGIAVGTKYGLRAHGAWDPAGGRRFNPAKLLIDPHARALDRVCRLHPSMFGHRAGDPAVRDETDSAPFVPRAIVSPPPTALPPVSQPGWSWPRTVIYELHVRGFTMRHPDIPAEIRGTFAALAHPAALAHLTALGITAVEIMPATAWVEERHLAALGLTNYWGYNPVAYLAPDPRLAPGGWAEVRMAVAALADAGIESILDVVLNHTGEGDALGPTLSLRGLDNALYYRLRDRSAYVDDTGCGNTLAMDRPHVLRLAMDALRTGVALGGFHGFRFDLATTLGRRDGGFDPAAPLLAAISQDPLLRGTKLIAEPWDVGWGGYQLGAFPGEWGEWNDRFRDDVRKFWRGDGGLGALATRMAGSADVMAAHRRPSRGVNFVVAHDGFTLADLVSYAAKHNEANGEGNRDGTTDNSSWNNGVEGPTEDPAIIAARRRDQIALLATLLLSRGTPMLSMGSEMGHSQGGNNNAYCQDSALAWLDWGAIDTESLAAARALVAARKDHLVLTEDRFLTGQGDPPDVRWLRPDGAAMTPDDWNRPGAGTLVMLLADADERVAMAIHRGTAPLRLALPAAGAGKVWRNVLAPDAGLVVPPRVVALFAEVAG